MKKLSFVLVIFTTAFCTPQQKVEFSLIGKTQGIENGTMLYLENTLDRVVLDSAIVENNSFTFKTILPASPMQSILHTKSFSQYRFIWLENKAMKFDASKTNFRKAHITGSTSEELSQALYTQIDTLADDERQKAEMKFVNDNPNSIVSANMLSVYTTTWGKKKTSELFEKFSTENKASVYGEKIANYIKLNQTPAMGEHFVDFEMPDENGNLKRLSDLKGKIVLLEFWASWCGPCREENPHLVNTYQKFKPLGFEVFAVSLDQTKADWLTAIEKDKLDWLHVSELNGGDNKASLIYGINGIPDNFLLDKKGLVVGRNLRGEILEKRLAELMRE